jgi:hypothetical protein
MIRFIGVTLAMAIVGGCASIPGGDSDRSYYGTVEKTMPITRPGQGGSPALYMFGLIGGLVNAALSGEGKTNFYLVNADGGQVSAQSDERFAIGDCVEVIPAKSAPAGRSFAYGDARVTASRRCGTSANAPEKQQDASN